MLILGKIKGWNFDRAYSADGTNESLRAEKKKLEARLAAIPGLISQLNHSIQVATNDINWVKSLKRRKKKKWEEEKGVVAEEWVRKAEANVVKMKGQVSSLTTEKSRIPGQISAIQKQIDTLVSGESKGLEKGLDAETAKEMGEIELQKEKERLEYERAIREAELKAESEKRALEAEKLRREQESQEKAAAEEKAGKNQTKLFIGIGIALILLVGGFILYKRKKAKAAAA